MAFLGFGPSLFIPAISTFSLLAAISQPALCYGGEVLAATAARSYGFSSVGSHCCPLLGCGSVGSHCCSLIFVTVGEGHPVM